VTAAFPTRLAPLALTVLVCGCSSVNLLNPPDVDGGFPGTDGGSRDSGIDAGPTDAGLREDQACAVLNANRCDRLIGCGLLDTVNRAECLRELTDSWCGPSTWPLHVAAGALRYDPVMAQACADALVVQPCVSYSAFPDACQAFLVPNAGLGAACFDGYEDCLDGVCRGAVCPRRCQPRALTGEVCGVDSDCRVGLFCRLSTTTPGVGQCAPFAQLGDPCDDYTRCVDALWCTGGSCHALPTVGQGCLLSRCDALSFCVAGADGGVCTGRLPVDAGCAGDQCLSSFACLTGACQPSQVAAGAACVSGQSCALGTTCVGAAGDGGVCVAPLQAGQRCALDTECEAELACLMGDGGKACGPRLTAGESCTATRQCQVDAECLQGTCEHLPVVGQPCGTTRLCQGGVCSNNPAIDGGFLCVPLLGPGVACAKDADCSSQRCVLGACLTACTP
jgi:hypothetical protein